MTPGDIVFTSDPHGVDTYGDMSRGLANLGLIFDHTEINTSMLLIAEEILARTKNIVRTPGVMLPNGDPTSDTDMKVAADGADNVTIQPGVAVDALGQLIEVVTQQNLAISAGDWAVIIKWAAADDTDGTFETNYPTTGTLKTRRIRSYTSSAVAWPNTDANAVLLARVQADGINPVIVTDDRDEALLHWASVNWVGVKSTLTDAILQQGIPAVRLDQGAGSTFFQCYEKPGSSGATLVVLAGHGLDAAGNVLKVSAATELAMANDNTYRQVQVYPSATYGGESTLMVVADGSTGGFYAARVKRNGAVLTVSDMRTKLWMRSMTDDANLPATPTRLRLMWGFENQQRQRGELDGEPQQSGHQQSTTELIWVKARVGDGGTGAITSPYTFQKTTNEVGSWTVNEWAGHQLVIGGRSYPIVSNTASVLTISTILPITTTVAFDIVPGGTSYLWNLQSKLPTVPIEVGEVVEIDNCITVPEEVEIGHYTTQPNTSWLVSQIFHSEEIPQVSIDLLEGSTRRTIVFHSLPATVPYRVRVQARGGLTSEFWSPWSGWVIIKPQAPDAQRVYLNPSAPIIRIEPNPGFIKVAIDWSAGSAPVKAAADRYFAGMEVTYTEGESLSSASMVSKNAAVTPVPCSAWQDISSRVGGQISAFSTDTCLTIPMESLCHVRMVLRVLLRDGTVTAGYEVGYESGAVICVTPRAAADGLGTVPASVDTLISTGGGGSGTYSTGVPCVITGAASEINRTSTDWQRVGWANLKYLLADPGGGNIGATRYYRVEAIEWSTRAGSGAEWNLRVAIAGTPNKVYTVSPSPGITHGGYVADREVLLVSDYYDLDIEAQVQAGYTVQDLTVMVFLRPMPDYVVPE